MWNVNLGLHIKSNFFDIYVNDSLLDDNSGYDTIITSFVTESWMAFGEKEGLFYSELQQFTFPITLNPSKITYQF